MRRGLIVLTLLAAGLAGGATARAQSPNAALTGACYCRAEGRLNCLGVFTEAVCKRTCQESFCDDWFWLERRPCWNWGYGG